MRRNKLVAVVVGLCCVALLQSLPEAQALGSRPSVQRTTGRVIGIGGRFGGRSRQFTLIADSYTAPNQVRELTDALARGGQDEMLRALSGMKTGRIQIGSGVGVPANVISLSLGVMEAQSSLSSTNATLAFMNCVTAPGRRTTPLDTRNLP